MKGYLSRGKARAMMVLMWGGLVIMLLGLEVDALFWVGAAAMLLSLCFLQACPHCGKHPRYAPQWSGQGKYYCSLCGERLSYDDEV